MDKNQSTRWSKGELELIRNTFGGEVGNDVLLQIRNVFMQFKGEVPKLKEDVLAVLRKLILPNLDPELPIGYQADIRNALAGSPDKAGIKDIPMDAAMLQIKANDIVEEYLKQRFDVLTGLDVDEECISLYGLKVKGDKSDEERYITMLAYLFLENSYIDGSLTALKTLANQKEKTEEQVKAEAKVNSSK